MSWLCDSSELIAGSWLSSVYAGHGVLGSSVPSSGAAGPSFFYSALSLPADNTKEVRALLTRLPLGTLVANEDGGYSYAGLSDYLLWQLYVDGVAATLDIGYGPGIGRTDLFVGPTIYDGPTADDATPGGSFGGGAPSVLSGGPAADDAGPAGGFGGAAAGALTGGPAADDAAVTGAFGGGSPSGISGDTQAGAATPGGSFSGVYAAPQGPRSLVAEAYLSIWLNVEAFID